MECLNNYWKATCYPNSLVCVCCGHAQIDTMFHNVTIGHDIETPSICKKLVVSEPFLIKRINEKLSTEFHYNMTSLNGRILCKEGMHQYDNKDNTLLSFCHGCYSSVNKKIHFALANRLYRGALPKNFWGITWVEEMVWNF